MEIDGTRLTRGGGLVAGALAALLLVAAGRVPHGNHAGGSHLSLVSAPTGELGVMPAGAFLDVSGLGTPVGKRSATGTVRVRNETAGTRVLRARLVLDGSDDFANVRARVSSAGVTLYDGTLSGAAPASERVLLQRGEERQLQVDVSVARGEPAPVGRASVTLQLASDPVVDGS